MADSVDLDHLSPEQIELLIARIPELPLQEKVQLLEQLEAYDIKNARRRAREDFLVFCHRVYPGFKEGPHHRHLKPLLHDMARSSWEGSEPPPHALRLTVSMPPRFGKALALDTEIPTPDRGFVRMGDLRVGDKVFAGDGTVTEVVGVSPVWRDRPVCRVTTNDGYSVVADMAHEWDVVVDRKRPKWKTVDTEYVLRKTAHTKESRALRIPLQGAAQYPEQAVTVDPYTLGVWLGDGRTDSAALCTADEFIFDKINAIEGAGYTEYAKQGSTRHWRPGPLGKRSSADSLHTRLRALGVLNNKHIPQTYMTAGREQRLSLLQGLMDTDGAVAKLGCCVFYNTNELLARQVQELVQSLGTKASLTSGQATLNGQNFGTCWKVHFFMSGAASLPRKAARCRPATRTPERYIRAEAAGTADTICIEVAHPSHLFLCTRGYIPTHNSESIAFLYVAWYMGHNPSHQVMMITHTEELSASFGRKVRDLIDTAEYQAIFEGSVQVSKDKAASGNWTTVQKGVYLALGVGGSAAGKGADLLVADDLVSEQAVLYGNPETAFDQAWQYMQVGPLQRLMPGGRIVMIGTRWGRRDPIGRALQWAADNPDSLPWHEVRFPAIINGKSLWPEQWPVEQLLAKKAGMLPQFWQAQYMQEPTAEEGALIKREYWRIWPKDKAPPPVEFVLQTWDTAHEVKTRNDYSACQTWGVWFNEETSRNELILLNGFHKRMEFPELKTRAKAEYDEWEPEELIIEKKAAGAPLIQELRQMDIAVTAISPSRGTRTQSNDKYARVNAIASIFRDGCVWAPDTRWAHEIIELCAAFPNGEFDDPVDCTEMAVSRYRRGGFLRLSDDAPEDDNLRIPRPAAYY